MASLEGLQEAVSRVAETVGASVVGIGDRWAHGSGIVIDKGRVLTNAHNLRGSEVSVTLPDGASAAGRPAGVDLDGDVAVIDVDTGAAPAVEWSSNGSVPIGAPVFALSNPGGGGLRVTFGLISGTQRTFRGPRGRRITGTLEHTAPLLPGSSGGPVVDASGRLLGVNTNRLGEGFYLAIPADASLKARVDALARGHSPNPPRLGVGLAPSHVARGLRRAVGLPEVDGLLVRQVEEGSHAQAAGVREGDLITGAGGRPTASFEELQEALEAARAAGGSIELEVVRGTEETKLTASLS